MSDAGARAFQPMIPRARARALPWMSVVIGSAIVALIPVIAPAPLLPPCGLLMLLAWRLLSPFALRRWAAAPLGFVDDLVSGQPLGSAVLLWSLCFLALELVETRLLFREFRQDWLLAAAAIAFCLMGGRLVAVPLTAAVDTAILLQIAGAALLFPLATWIAAAIDARRNYA